MAQRHVPVVILHGLLDCSEGWARLADSISVPAIAFDLPGYGHSDSASRGSIHGYARDVLAGLDLLGVERFALVGHSLGGAVAAAVAELVPAHVSALVLLGSRRVWQDPTRRSGLDLPGVRNVLEATLPLVLSSRRAVTASFVKMVANGTEPERDVVERVIGRAGELVIGAREGTRAVVDAGRSRNAFHRRRVPYDGPVFAVWGDHDRLVPVAHRHGVKTAFPQAQIQIWYGMGHHPLSERYDELLALVTNALTGVDRPTHRRAIKQLLAS